MQWINKTSIQQEEFYHPFFNYQTFYSPDRRTQVFFDEEEYTHESFNQWDESHCAFCLNRINEATPEKTRVYQQKNKTIQEKFPSLEPKHDQNILFRRQGNLFEILPYYFWEEKYQYQAPKEQIEDLELAYQNPITKEYLLNLLAHKYNFMKKDFNNFSEKQKKDALKAFYTGFHDLICSGSHFDPHSKKLFHTGSYSNTEYQLVIQHIVQVIQDMHIINPHIHYVTVFQNWLSQAGASFKHWHKQILGIDFWGRPLERESKAYRNNPHAYYEFIIECANTQDLVIAENEHALAYVEIGGKTGLITICSKSENLRPYDHNIKEQNAMSDLSHAIAGSLGVATPYNEEWFYTPFHTDNFKTPWRIIFELRSHNLAGFEQITQRAVNSISPRELASLLRERLIKNPNKADDIIIHSPKISKSIFRSIS